MFKGKSLIIILLSIMLIVGMFIKGSNNSALEPLNSVIKYVEAQGQNVVDKSKRPRVIARKVKKELLNRKRDSYEELKRCVQNQERGLRFRSIADGEVINLDKVCLEGQ